MDWNALFRQATGKDYQQLTQEGSQQYPNVPPGSKHHALGSRLTTERLREHVGAIPAFLGSQTAGLGMEAAEYFRGDPKSVTMDTPRDLAANLIGGLQGAGAPRAAGAVEQLLGWTPEGDLPWQERLKRIYELMSQRDTRHEVTRPPASTSIRG